VLDQYTGSVAVAADLLDRKNASVAVVLPALNEAATVGQIVRIIRDVPVISRGRAAVQPVLNVFGHVPPRGFGPDKRVTIP